MKNLINYLFSGNEKEAWSHNNLQPAEPVVRINWYLYDMVVKSRQTIGVAEIQSRQFAQMVRLRSDRKISTVFCHE